MASHPVEGALGERRSGDRAAETSRDTPQLQQIGRRHRVELVLEFGSIVHEDDEVDPRTVLEALGTALQDVNRWRRDAVGA